MKKLILISVALLVLLGGAGGAAAYFFLFHHAPKAAAKLPPPKPIFFAQLNNLVVTVPADSTGQSGQAYIQFSVQFSSTDQKAVAMFDALQPIVESETIALLMSKNAKQLMDPSTHAALAGNCLGIANKVLNKSAGFTPPDPFTAAYITNIVQQD